MKDQLKRRLFHLLVKIPEGVIVTFLHRPSRPFRQNAGRSPGSLIPDRRHYVVTCGTDDRFLSSVLSPATKILRLEPAGTWAHYRQLRTHFRHLRIALAPTLFAGPPDPLRRAAILLAPTKILAYNHQIERHHLRLTTPVASILFLRRVPVDRITSARDGFHASTIRPYTRRLTGP